jgi:hypothetical protein
MNSDTCPLCNRSLRVGIQQAGRRICSVCGNGIKKNHRYRIGSNGLLQHRDCKHPTGCKIESEKGMFE